MRSDFAKYDFLNWLKLAFTDIDFIMLKHLAKLNLFVSSFLKQKDPSPIEPIKYANVLLYLGDSITTDHISPAGSIARNSPAAKYLSERGLAPRDFNSYGSRRGNDAVMSRGTFANIRLVNKLMGTQTGPKTVFMPTQAPMDIFDAAEQYKLNTIPVILRAGKEYGSGSSRDWAAKGPWMLGIKAIIAESYERIHRSNLIGMGIVPFQFMPGETAESLQLTGKEKYSIHIDDSLVIRQIVNVEVKSKLVMFCWTFSALLPRCLRIVYAQNYFKFFSFWAFNLSGQFYAEI